VGDVQRIPGGLLELLSAKTSGFTLDNVSRELVPVLDMLQLFGLGQPIETINVTDAALAEAGQIFITVPATEWWVLYAAGSHYVRTSTQTGVIMSLGIATGTPAVSVPVAAGPKESVAPGVAAGVDCVAITWMPPYPMMLPPGTQLVFQLDILGTDATLSVACRARIARLT
jgi:hypothetical protein